MSIKAFIAKTLRGLFYVLILLVLSYFSMKFYVNHQLAKRSYTDAYNNCHKIWATRGLVENGLPVPPSNGNSIKTIQAAFQHGADGSEIDLFFDPERKQFIISHDFPYNLKEGELLTLEKLLSNIEGDNYLWLDFKKLRKLDAQSADNAVARLQSITQTRNWKERIYIEGADPVNLGKFRHGGFKTLFDVHPLPDSEPFTAFVLTIYKAAFYFGDFTVMGMKHGDLDAVVYGPDAKKQLGNIPLFIYHTPDDPALLRDLLATNSVRVILMQDHTLNRFDIDNCSSESN